MQDIFFTVLNFIINVLIIIGIIGVLVLVHEFGHYIVARLTGMLVEEFAIGFGPNVFSYKKGETNYMIKAFPLGGYVKILGEAGEEDELMDSAKDEDGLTKHEKKELELIKNSPRSFTNKPVLSRFLVMIAGVTMNYLLAVICFYIWLAGNNYSVQLPLNMMDFQPRFAEKVLEKKSEITYSALVDGGTAKNAGFPDAGIIKNIDGQTFTYDYEFRNFVNANPNKNINIEICELKENLEICESYPVTISNEGKIGVALKSNYALYMRYTGISKVLAGFANSVDNLKLMGYVISGLFKTARDTGNYQDVAVNSFSSPIALYFVVDSFKQYGAMAIIRLIGEFSFSLAIINVLPIPALDGGRIVILAIEAIRRKPMNRKVENAIIAISFYALILLMLVVVLKDIWFIQVLKDMFAK